MITLQINGKRIDLDADPAMPLLWALRDRLNLTGTKFGCGIGACGACTVLVERKAKLSCKLNLSEAKNKEISTIEAAATDPVGKALQDAWVAHNVPQCGYCQSGQIMSAIAVLKQKPNPNDDDIDAEMRINLCRCGTYQRIRAAIKEAAQTLGKR
jgi:isoquinoline 1-oxidoreductase subunit alpha